ncbi:WD40 repeat-like protein [Trichoderma longibrachiatum ATCC 18648]|uniref:WD40 repeat-like protein n=1 Tax=Trichoderma longibrachiatum ATCC 18648 TaxID=983965 RepID=A0A2T4BYT0_TRILO|nr:WD40 repeat-like protein [Trichoderma longibrachiatum ATCC 18648]
MASIVNERILAAAPVTNRGQGTQLSADSKGKRIAYASGKSIFVRSIDDPSDCKEYTGHTHPTTIARFAPSGFKIASGDSAGILRIWEPESIETTRGEYPIISGPLLDIAWDGDSQRIIAVGNGRQNVRDHQVGVVIPHGRTDGLIISINLAGELTYLQEGKDEPVRVIQGHDKGITALTGGSDGSGATVVTGSFDGRVCSWDLETGDATVLDGQSHTNQIPQFATSSGKIYSVGWDDTIRTIDDAAKTFVGESAKLPSQPRGAASAGDIVYVAGISGVAAYSNGKLLKETPLDFTPDTIAAHGSYVAIGGQGNTARIYTSDSNGNLEYKESVSSPLGTVTALAFSKDGSHLAVGTSVGKILVFKVGTWELVTDRWSAHTARVTCISWEETGAYAASGSLDSHIFVWCLEKRLQGQRIKAPNAHLDGVTGITWIRGGRLASSGKDATVKLWEVNSLP